MSDVIDFAKGDGLVPVIVQEDGTGTVLMLAYMNREAFERTVATGYATYWSRSRSQFWVKGETSGHKQAVRAIHVDCDGDTILLKVEQHGAACHEGYHDCFFRKHTGRGWDVIAEREVDPKTVYGRA